MRSAERARRRVSCWTTSSERGRLVRRSTTFTSIAFATLLLLTILPTTALRAQTLADRVPGDSFVYFGWKGTATPGNGYDKSHLQAVLTASKLQPTIEQLI